MELAVGARRYRLRWNRKGMQVQGMDLEAELAAGRLSGRYPLHLEVLAALRRLTGERPMGEVFDEKGAYRQTLAARQVVSGVLLCDRLDRGTSLPSWFWQEPFAPEVQRWITEQGELEQRALLLSNLHIDPGIRKRLVRDPWVAAQAITNYQGNRPVAVHAVEEAGMMEELAHHNDPELRAAAAECCGHWHLYQQLTEDPEPVVRSRLAWNPRLPRSYLEQLAKDPEPRVWDAATRALEDRDRERERGRGLG